MNRRSLLNHSNVANGLDALSKPPSISTRLLPESWHQANSQKICATNSPVAPPLISDLRSKLNKRHKLQSSYDDLDGVELGEATCITSPSIHPANQNGERRSKRFTRWGPERSNEPLLSRKITSGEPPRDEDYYSPTSVCSSDEGKQVEGTVARPYLLPTPGSHKQRRSSGLLPSPALLDTPRTSPPPPPPPPPPRPRLPPLPNPAVVEVPIVVLPRDDSAKSVNSTASRFTVTVAGDGVQEGFSSASAPQQYHATDSAYEIKSTHLSRRTIDNSTARSAYIPETPSTASFNQFHVPQNSTENVLSDSGYHSQSASLPEHHNIPIQKYNSQYSYSEYPDHYFQPTVTPGIQQYSTNSTPKYPYPYPYQPEYSSPIEELAAQAGPSHYQSQYPHVQQTPAVPQPPRHIKLNVESSTNYIDEIQQNLSTDIFDEIIAKTLDPAVLVRCIKALGEIKEVLPIPGHGMMSVSDKKTVFMTLNDVLRRLHCSYEEQSQYKNTTVVNCRKQQPPSGFYRSKPEFIRVKILEMLSFLTNSEDISKLDEVDLTYNEEMESVPEGLNWVYSLTDSDFYVDP